MAQPQLDAGQRRDVEHHQFGTLGQDRRRHGADTSAGPNRGEHRRAGIGQQADLGEFDERRGLGRPVLRLTGERRVVQQPMRRHFRQRLGRPVDLQVAGRGREHVMEPRQRRRDDGRVGPAIAELQREVDGAAHGTVGPEATVEGDRDLGIGLQERRQGRCDGPGAHAVRRGDAHGPLFAPVEVEHGPFDGGGRALHGQHMVEHQPARFGEGDARGAPVEQPDPQPRFQVVETTGHGRLRNAQRPAGRADAASFGHRPEHTKIRPVGPLPTHLNHAVPHFRMTPIRTLGAPASGRTL